MRGMEHRAAADAINGNTIDQVGTSITEPSTYGARKEAESVGLNCGEPHPPDIDAKAAGLAHWQKCYRDFRKLKFAFEEKNNR